MKPLIPLLGGIFLAGAGFFGSYFHSNFQSKTEIIEEPEKQPREIKLTSSWKGPRFLSTHHFKRLEFSFPNGLETTFKESVSGSNPKIKGNYYVEWVDNDWENHVKNLNSRNEKGKAPLEALLKGKELSPSTLKEVCDAYAKKELKVSGDEKNFTFKSGGESSVFEEWKNAILVCTKTIRLEDYVKVEGMEVVTQPSDISSGALKLREEDEKTNENTSMAYGKEYLQDRLRGLSDEEVKEEVFKWCKYLGNKAASSGVWNNDKINFKDFCMKSKNSSVVKNESSSIGLGNSRVKNLEGGGTVGNHLESTYLTSSGGLGHKRMVRSSKEISDSVWSLRQEDEENYESSIKLGKEFLYDRLKEKSLELIKEEVFEWCSFLKTRPSSTMKRNLENLRTYCLIDRDKAID